MKEIMAIIRMNNINKTKEALGNEGFPAVTVRKVHGRGKQKVNYEMIQHFINNGAEVGNQLFAEGISEGHRLIPKRLLTMIVNDEEVESVVNTIISVNQTGNAGDGKIFVIPVSESIRIRTGEVGEKAI